MVTITYTDNYGRKREQEVYAAWLEDYLGKTNLIVVNEHGTKLTFVPGTHFKEEEIATFLDAVKKETRND